MAKVNFDTSKKLDITCRRGDSFSLELTLKDSSGNLLNLHNDSFNFLVIGKNINGESVIPISTDNFVDSGITTEAVITASITDDVSTTAETATGKVKFELTGAQMKNVTSGSHQYDIQHIDSSDFVNGEPNFKTILTGKFTINKDSSILA
tara:strand:- start:1931 stop:2380 length:450 start_codon:yes stop_codon:yes gene_type:complete